MPQSSTFSPGAITSRSVFARADSRSAALGRSNEVAARLLVGLELDETAFFRLLEEVGEGLEPIVGLIETGPPALERLLDHRAPDVLALAALGDQRLQRLEKKIEGLLLLVFARRCGFPALFGGAALLLVLAHEVVVVDEFVAVGDQQVGAGVLHTDANHGFGVLPQLGYQWRKIRVAADDDKGVDVLLGVAEVKRVDHHADVGRVLARLAQVRDLD